MAGLGGADTNISSFQCMVSSNNPISNEIGWPNSSSVFILFIFSKCN